MRLNFDFGCLGCSVGLGGLLVLAVLLVVASCAGTIAGG